MPLTVAQIRARLEAVMRFESEEHWLEEAERRLEAHHHLSLRQKVYDCTTVGARMRTAREIAGLTQPQLSAALGLNDWAISNMETGKRDLPARKLPALCTVLGVSVPWLLGESEQGGPSVPRGILRTQKRVNWLAASGREKQKARVQAELERVRGLRGPPRAKREG